jgi:hypothetical protein
MEHPNAKQLKESNEELGLPVYQYRGHYLLILGDDQVWRSGDQTFLSVKSGLYSFNEKGELITLSTAG